MVLPDEVTTSLIYNNGQPLKIPPFTLCFRRWSRFRNSTAMILPSLVDVELRGIPAHAWELETAEHLMDEWGWVRELHPDTVDRRDYSSFRFKAWCSQPELIPGEMDLIIVEPPVIEDEVPPLKRALKYEIKVRSALAPSSGPRDGPSPPPPRDDPDHGRRRRRRQAPASPVSAAQDSNVRVGTPRVSVLRRQSSGPVPVDHVAEEVDGQHAPVPDATIDGQQAPVPEATQPPSLPSTASVPLGPIDDMAATIIVPRFWEGYAIPEMLRCSFELSDVDADSMVQVAAASEAPEIMGSALAHASGLPSGFSPVCQHINSHNSPDATVPELLDPISSPPRCVREGLSSSPLMDDIPLLAPVLTALCASPMGTADEIGVAMAPLQVPPLAESVDVAVAAVAPHRTSLRGSGDVDVTAATPSTGAQLPSDDGHQEGGRSSAVFQMGESTPSLQVYSRRRFKGSSRNIGATSPSQPLSPTTAFIQKIAKSPNGLLPIPHISKRRKKKIPPPSEAPRRSRRIAGLGAEKPMACPTHLLKRLMRALDLEVDDEKVQLDQQLLDDYARRFSQHVTPSHTRALAALFGRTPTEDDFAVGMVDCPV